MQVTIFRDKSENVSLRETNLKMKYDFSLSTQSVYFEEELGILVDVHIARQLQPQVGQCVGGSDQEVHRDAPAAVGGARPHWDGPRHRHALHHMLAQDKG